MITFKEAINEGIFDPHNGRVLHGHLYDHIRKTEVQEKLQKYGSHTVMANEIHPSLPKDLKVGVELTHGDQFGGEYHPSFFDDDNKHKITIILPTRKAKEAPHLLQSQEGKDIITHEHGHYADMASRTKKNPKAAERYFFTGAFSRGKENAYLTNRAEKEAHQREIVASVHRARKIEGKGLSPRQKNYLKNSGDNALKAFVKRHLGDKY